MTKVQLRFPLQRPLDETLLDRIAAAHGIYGIVRIQPVHDSVLVEFDASRLFPREVEAALAAAGVPLATAPARTVDTQPAPAPNP
jgi:hypothetical protein